jgi:branched-chain amino acid transport system ATP-binding protein
MLECEALETYYGAAHVLYGMSLAVRRGSAACILGRNGVGKTTCLRSIMGLTPPRSGSIRFGGSAIAGLPAFRIARLGIGYVPEDRRIFADLSVEDNLLIAERQHAGGSGWTLAKAYEIFPPLAEFRHRMGGNLSGGQQQMLTIARTLMGNPSLLLIDEPTEGLSPIMVRVLEEAIMALKRAGMTMLVAAQDMRFAHRVADHIYVMNRGTIVYSGRIDDARRDEAVIRSHLVV